METKLDNLYQQGLIGDINCMSISNDNKYVATSGGGHDGQIRLWNLQTKELVSTMKHHRMGGMVCFLKFSLDGNFLYSGYMNGTGKVWRVKNGKKILAFGQDDGNIYLSLCGDISPNNRYVVMAYSDAGGNNGCKLWDLPIKPSVMIRRTVQFVPQRRFLTGRNEKSVRTFNGHAGEVSAVVFTRDSKQIVTGSFDHTLKLWSVQNGKELRTFTGHSDLVNSVSVSFDNKFVISGSRNTAILWDLQSGERVKTYNDESYYAYHNNDGLEASISSDNSFVVTTTNNASVKIWDFHQANVTHTLTTGHTRRVTSASLSSDDSLMLLTGSSYDGSVRAIDLSRVDNLPGGWRKVRPLVMLRWLVDQKRAFPPSSFTSSTTTTTKSVSLTNGVRLTKEKRVLHALMTMKSDDVFRYIVSFL